MIKMLPRITGCILLAIGAWTSITTAKAATLVSAASTTATDEHSSCERTATSGDDGKNCDADKSNEQSNNSKSRALACTRIADYECAIENSSQAIRENSTDESAYTLRAEAYQAQEKYLQAIADLNEVIRLNPNSKSDYLRRGMAYVGLQDYGRANEDFTRHIALNGALPSTKAEDRVAEGLNARAFSHIKIGQYKLAVTDLNDALKIRPNFNQPLVNRGFAYSKLGQEQKAIVDFDKAIKFTSAQDDPVLPRAYLHRGNALRAQKKLALALDDYTESIRLDSSVAETFGDRCLARIVWRREFDMAMSDCNRGLELAPESLAIKTSRGVLFLNQENYPAALADFDSVLQTDASHAEALYGRGIAKTRLGNKSSGKLDIANAVKREKGVAAKFSSYGLRP